MKASVIVASVEAFIYFISSMEASAVASMKTPVEVIPMKASITSMKALVEALVEAPVVVTYVEAFKYSISSMEASMKAFTEASTASIASMEASIVLPWKLP